MLEWHYCMDWILAARIFCALQWLQEVLEAACWGCGLRVLVYWIGATAMTGGQQLNRGKSKFPLMGPCALDWI